MRNRCAHRVYYVRHCACVVDVADTSSASFAISFLTDCCECLAGPKISHSCVCVSAIILSHRFTVVFQCIGGCWLNYRPS
jgi:hypothetical protein